MLRKCYEIVRDTRGVPCKEHGLQQLNNLLFDHLLPSRDERTVMSLVCHVTSLSHIFKIWSVTVTSLSRFFRDRRVTVTTLSRFFRDRHFTVTTLSRFFRDKRVTVTTLSHFRKLRGVTVTWHTCNMNVTSLSRLVCHCPCISAPKDCSSSL